MAPPSHRSLLSVSSLVVSGLVLLTLAFISSAATATATATGSVPRRRRGALLVAWARTPPPTHHRRHCEAETSLTLTAAAGRYDRAAVARSRSRSHSRYVQSNPFQSHGILQSLHEHRPRRRRCHRLEAATQQDPDSGDRLSSSSSSTQDPVDDVLRWVTSDTGSIALGLVGLLALLLSQVLGGASNEDVSSSLEATQAATRSNLLAVFACGAVLVNGVSKLDVQSATAESVVLQGIAVVDPRVHPSFTTSSPAVRSQAPWFLQSVLAATPASTAVLVTRSDLSSPEWKVACAAGILPSDTVSELSVPSPSDTPILNKAMSAGQDETYLPTLQALPGRTEFLGYLPSNTQAVLIVPVTSSDVAPTDPSTFLMVLGSNRARSFTPRDILWCQALAIRLGQTFERGP